MVQTCGYAPIYSQAFSIRAELSAIFGLGCLARLCSTAQVSAMRQRWGVTAI